MSRIAGAILLSVVIACLHGLHACLAALCCGLLLLALSRAPLNPARFAAVNAFVLLMWLAVPWTAPGPAIWRWGWLGLSKEGIDLCVLITLKANAILAVFIALVATMPLSSFAQGLAGLHCPAKLVWMLLLMERNVHLLKREWRQLVGAARLRCFVPRATLASYKTMAAMLALLLVRADARGRKLREAMLLAGFDGRLPAFANSRPGVADGIFLLLLVCCCAGLAWLNYV